MKYIALMICMLALPALAQPNLKKLKEQKEKVESANKEKKKLENKFKKGETQEGNAVTEAVNPAKKWVNQFDLSLSSATKELQETAYRANLNYAENDLKKCQEAIDSIEAVKPNYGDLPQMKQQLVEQNTAFQNKKTEKQMRTWKIIYGDASKNMINELEEGIDFDRTNISYNLKQAKKAVDTMQVLNPDYPPLAAYQKQFDSLNRVIFVEFETHELGLLLGKFESGMHEFRSDIPNYTGYQSDYLIREKFDKVAIRFNKAKLPGEEINQRFKEIESFFTNEEEKGRLKAISRMGSLFNQSDYWSAENRKTDEFFDAFTMDSRPQMAINDLSGHIEKCESVLRVFPDSPESKTTLNSMKERKGELEIFAESEELDELYLRARKRRADNTFPYKSLRSDSEVNSAVKRDFDSELGTIMKINTIDRDWGIHKLPNGRINYKNIGVQVIYKDKDGNCKLVTGSVRKEYYEGSWGKAEFYDYTHNEMNCNNANKPIDIPRN